jgi:hypothetical protein
MVPTLVAASAGVHASSKVVWGHRAAHLEDLGELLGVGQSGGVGLGGWVVGQQHVDHCVGNVQALEVRSARKAAAGSEGRK